VKGPAAASCPRIGMSWSAGTWARNDGANASLISSSVTCAALLLSMSSTHRSRVPTGVPGIVTGLPGVGAAEAAGNGEAEAAGGAVAVGATEPDAEGAVGLALAPQPATSATTNVAATGNVAHRAPEKRG